MKLLILYATREGHTRRIAEHLGAAARTRGIDVAVLNAAELPADFALASYTHVILAASVHQSSHEPEMVSFVKKQRVELEQKQAIFISVSLSEVGAEDPARTSDDRARYAADVQKMIDAFLAETGWHPSKVQAAAGALLYSKYNFLIRFVMKRIARKQGVSTDTSRDHEFTDWAALDRLVDEISE